MLCYLLNLLPLDTNNKCNKKNSHMTDVVLKGPKVIAALARRLETQVKPLARGLDVVERFLFVYFIFHGKNA